MEQGDLVKFEDYDGEVYFGYIMYLDTDYGNCIFYHIRWSDGSETEEYPENPGIKVIQ